MKHLSEWIRSRMVLVIVIMAAVMLEVISAVQYRYTRGLLEQELERGAFKELGTAALRIQGIMTKAEVAASTQLWHAENHLHEPDYMSRLVNELVQVEHGNMVGAAMAFEPDFYPEKGRLYEPYARRVGDSVCVNQIGGEKHDYTKRDFYLTAMRGDTTRWTSPYLDAEGAKDVVITYALPLLDEGGKPVGVLAVDLDTDWIGKVVNLHHFNPSSFTLVMSPEGDFIAGPADSVASRWLVERIVEMVNDSTVAREKKANGRVTGFAFADEEGEKGHVYYVNKKDAPHWQMVLVCYDDEVFGKLDDMRRDTLWLALAGLVVLGIIIQLFANNHRRLHETQMEQERIGSELRIAKEIQMEMLPKNFCQQKTGEKGREDIDVVGSLVPAREVGGDLFDFFVRDERLFFCIGDVSGKGVPSALLMAVTHSLFRSVAAHVNNPAHIMQLINEASCQGNEANMFVTLFVGVLHLPTGRLGYCNAGHDKPIVIEGQGASSKEQEARSEEQGAGGKRVQLLDVNPNLPVGLFDDVPYEEQETLIQPDTLLFLYTDGLTEAKDSQRKLFGMERIEKVLQDFDPHGSPQQLLQTMTEAVTEFVGNAEQSDDRTMLAIRYKGKVSTFGSSCRSYRS